MNVAEIGAYDMEYKTKRKKAYNLVKSIFRNEKEIKLAILEAKTAKRKEICGGGGQSYKSDPTAGETVRHLSDVPVIRLDNWIIHRPEDWLKVIAFTYENTRENERRIMRKYYSGRKISEIAMQDDCGYAESTLYAILDNFQHMAVEIACQYGLVRVVDA